MSIHVDGEDRAGLFSDERFNLIRIHCQITLPDIAKDRFNPVEGKRMGCGRKGKGGRNDLPRKPQSLYRNIQRLMAVNHQIDLSCTKISFQLFCKLLHQRPIIGQLVSFPYTPAIFVKLFLRRQKWASNKNLFHRCFPFSNITFENKNFSFYYTISIPLISTVIPIAAAYSTLCLYLLYSLRFHRPFLFTKE